MGSDFPDGWHGWWTINGGAAAAGAPVHGVSRSTDKLDIFVTGTDRHTYTAAWEPDFADAWHGWWNLLNGTAALGAHVTAVSRSADHLDVFVVGTDGGVYTAAWEPDFADGWHGWWRIGNVVAPQGAAVYAVSRSTDKLDIFVTDVHGSIMTAAWEPDFADGWHGWWQINGGAAAPGAAVTAESAAPTISTSSLPGPTAGSTPRRGNRRGGRRGGEGGGRGGGEGRVGGEGGAGLRRRLARLVARGEVNLQQGDMRGTDSRGGTAGAEGGAARGAPVSGSRSADHLSLVSAPKRV